MATKQQFEDALLRLMEVASETPAKPIGIMGKLNDAINAVMGMYDEQAAEIARLHAVLKRQGQ